MPKLLEYSCESGPLLVADVASAAVWSGTDDDGSGVVVEYMARDVLKLPKELLSDTKQGMHQRTFETLAAAREFERELLAAMEHLHPKAKALPRYPDGPGWVMHYIGDERIYSIDETRHTAYERACKKIKGGASVVAIDRKHKALFMDQSAGRGWIAYGPNSLLVVRPETDEGYRAQSEVLTAARQLDPPKPKGSLKISTGVVLVHAAFSAADIARNFGKAAAFSEGAAAMLASEEATPLRVGDPPETSGALLRLEPGNYSACYTESADLAGHGASVLWLRPE